MRRIVTIVAASVFLLASAAARADAPVPLSIGWITVPISLVPIFEAKKDVTKHYGKTYTLNAIHFAGTTPQITALASGDLDIAELSFSSLALAIQNAHLEDLRMIADSLQDGVKPNSYSGPFVVMKDGPIKTVEDLKGKSVSVNVIGAGIIDIGMRFDAAPSRTRSPARLQRRRGEFSQSGTIADVGQGRDDDDGLGDDQ